MKKVIKLTMPRFFICCFLSLFSMAVWAQESNGSSGGETKSTTTTTTKNTDITTTGNAGTTWYTQPWVWIVGAAVFILLLVALLSGSKGRDTATDRITVKKTIERDSGNTPGT